MSGGDESKRFTRRDASKLIGGALVSLSPAVRLSAAVRGAARESAKGAAADATPSGQEARLTPQPSDVSGLSPLETKAGLTAEDVAFLEEMERRGCLYFSEQAGPATGQVLDRAVNRTSTGAMDRRRPASIAATGFGLTALCIADSRGYMPGGRIRQQVIQTLDFHLNRLPHQHGFFFHYNDVTTGRALSWSEVSSIDTALLMCGVLTCRAYFDTDARIYDLATRLFERVEWPWMMNGGTTFSMGWHPDSGFISTRWDHYCELMMIYLLAIGSRSHPVPASAWDAFARPRIHYGPYNFISGRDPLFVHQYSHAWFDFVNVRDRYADYFANSVTATRAHKAFLSTLRRGYNNDYWGVTASDWQHGYTAWGGPPLMGPVDGSVVPCAAAGSLPFLPKECVRVLRALYDQHGTDAWGRYGFCDAFHPSQYWYDPDVLGIDVGIGVLMAENLRTRFVWDTFMKNPEPQAAMLACGFRTI